MGYPVQLNNTTIPLRFLMVLTSDHITGATGKTVTATILKSGDTTFVSPSGTITELGSGWYQIEANADDASNLGVLSLHATASGCDPTDEEYTVVASLTALASALSPSSTSALALTAQRLIKRVYRTLGVLAEGEDPSAEQAEDGLESLNEMLDAWNTERLLLPAFQRSTYTLTANVSTYTIGPTGDFSATRPMDLEQAAIIPVGQTYEFPVEVMTRDSWADIRIKSLTSTFPFGVIYEPTEPDGTIRVFPVPTTAATLVLYTMQTLAQFTDLTTAYTLQPGYAAAIRWNLALLLSPEYDVPAAKLGLIAEQARQTKGNIKRQNENPVDLTLGPSGLTGGPTVPGWAAIYTGTE